MKIKPEIMLILVLFLSFLVQIVDIDKPTVTGDEYIVLTTASLSIKNPLFPLSIYKNHVYFHGHPLVAQYIFDLFFCLYPSLTLLRFVSVVFTIFSIYLTFLLGKGFFDTRVGILASAFLGLTILFIAFTRLALMDSILIFFITLSVYFFSKVSKKLGWIFLGVSFGVKYSAVILIAVFIIHELKKKIRIKELFKNMILFISAFSLSNITGFFMWESISPRRDLFFEIPLILKTFLYHFHGFFRWLIPISTEYMDKPQTFSFLSKIFEYTNVLYFQVGLFPIILFFIGMIVVIKQKKEYKLMFLWWAIFAFIFACLMGGGMVSKYLLPMLPPFFLLAAYGFFELCKVDKNVRILLLLFLSLFFIKLSYDIIRTQPHYLLYGHEYGIKSTGVFVDGQFTKTAVDYLNNFTELEDKIYLGTAHVFTNFKYTPFNIYVNRTITTNISEADYVMVDLRFKTENSNNSTVEWLEKNYKLNKTFGLQDFILVWIYKKDNYQATLFMV